MSFKGLTAELRIVNTENKQISKTLKPLRRRSKRVKDHTKLEYSPSKLDKIVELKNKISDMETEYKTMLKDLHEEFLSACNKLEVIGSFETTMSVEGHDSAATLTRKDQYTKVDFEESEYISEILGDDLYDEFFEEKVDAELKVDWFDFTVDAASAGFEVEKYFKTTQYLKMKKGAMKKKADIRHEIFRTDKDHLLGQLFAQCQYKPSIRVKK